MIPSGDDLQRTLDALGLGPEWVARVTRPPKDVKDARPWCVWQVWRRDQHEPATPDCRADTAMLARRLTRNGFPCRVKEVGATVYVTATSDRFPEGV